MEHNLLAPTATIPTTVSRHENKIMKYKSILNFKKEFSRKKKVVIFFPSKFTLIKSDF